MEKQSVKWAPSYTTISIEDRIEEELEESDTFARMQAFYGLGR